MILGRSVDPVSTAQSTLVVRLVGTGPADCKLFDHPVCEDFGAARAIN